MLNSEICNSERWNFLQRKSQLTLPKNSGEIENTIDGRIECIIIDGQRYEYCADFELFFVNSQPQYTYGLFNDKILFPIFNQDKTVEVIYYTKNCATDADGKEQLGLNEYSDKSLIPEPFVEPLLVYGSCMRLKGNPQHIRFSYWLSMYKDALANMRSRISGSIDETPVVRMFRK